MEKLYNEANPEPRKKDDIQWNFTKFLIGRDGQVIARFEPTVDMKEVEKQTSLLLSKALPHKSVLYRHMSIVRITARPST